MRGGARLVVVLLCGCKAVTAVEPAPVPAEPTPVPVEPARRPAERQTCWQQDDPAKREACLSFVMPPGPYHSERVESPRGYACALFSPQAPRCDGDVRVLARWSDASSCPHVLTLYWAPQQNPSGPAADLGNGRPGEVLHPVVFSSDGVVFGYLRLDDYVVESEVCDERSEKVSGGLLEWGRALQAEIFEPP